MGHGFVLNFSHMVQHIREFFFHKKFWKYGGFMKIYEFCNYSVFPCVIIQHLLWRVVFIIYTKVLKHCQDEYICILNKMIFFNFFEKKIKNFWKVHIFFIYKHWSYQKVQILFIPVLCDVFNKQYIDLWILRFFLIFNKKIFGTNVVKNRCFQFFHLWFDDFWLES